MHDHIPRGLAAIARAARDPRISVTSLREAIKDGRIKPEHENGKVLVTLAQARAALEPAPVPAPEPAPEPAPKTPIKLKRNRGRSRTRG